MAGLLRYSPLLRLTALEALEHRYFDDLAQCHTQRYGPALFNFGSEGTGLGWLRRAVIFVRQWQCG